MGGQRRGCHVRRHAFALTQSSLDISRGGPARASVIKIFFKNRSGGSAQKIDDAFWGSNGARAHSAEPLSKMLRAMLQEPTSCIERAPMLCLSVCARGLGNVEGCFSPVAKIPISFAPWCRGLQSYIQNLFIIGGGTYDQTPMPMDLCVHFANDSIKVVSA